MLYTYKSYTPPNEFCRTQLQKCLNYIAKNKSEFQSILDL